MDIGLLRLATVSQVIVEVLKVVDIGLKRPATLHQVITEVVDLGEVLSSTIHVVTAEDVLIELYLGHKRLDTLPPEI